MDARHETRLSERYLGTKVDWPSTIAAPSSADVLRDRFRGCLLWGAVGDALGRTVEGQSPAAIRARYGEAGLRDYVPWYGWRSGPIGTITDDTQLTMEVAKTLLVSSDVFDVQDFVRRLQRWLPHGRGIGRSTRGAVEALIEGTPWWESADPAGSGGNGAAMRAAPVGLARALRDSPFALRRDAVLSALPTHNHPVGVAGAVSLAAGVAWCVRECLRGGRAFDPQGFLGFVSGSIEGIEPCPTMERRPHGHAVLLTQRIRELRELLHLPPEEAFAHTFNGAFALESVPAAIYCFLRSPDDPVQVILTAVNGGYDADTVASMAGNLVGTWCGAQVLRKMAPRWWDELEYREELVSLADGLAELAGRL